MTIVDLSTTTLQQRHAAARMLIDAFRLNWPNSWPDLTAAHTEVEEALSPGRIGRTALDEDGAVLGWIGGAPQYRGRVWELHPLVVRPDRQMAGIGRALVADLEEQVRQRGGLTIVVGSDDENNLTSLGGVDLYPDPLEHLRLLRNLRRHPYEFYQKVGFVLVGVIPDANGLGRPDILMAKRVG